MNAILADAATRATTDFSPAFPGSHPPCGATGLRRSNTASVSVLRDVLVLTANASVKTVFAFPALKQPEQQLDRNPIARQAGRRPFARWVGPCIAKSNIAARARVRRERSRLNTPRRNAPFELQPMQWRGIRR
ncbi:MAG: hypothetical protein C5B56_11520 [Proteobacteria bacterium]|nr:MAG: hypothetical protein C5B56_11520 [Pseudomonadota bacterium]